MSGVWLDKELNANTGFPLLSMAYSTTVPTGKPAQAPNDPMVERTPVLHEKALYSEYCCEHQVGCTHFDCACLQHLCLEALVPATIQEQSYFLCMGQPRDLLLMRIKGIPIYIAAIRCAGLLRCCLLRLLHSC